MEKQQKRKYIRKININKDDRIYLEEEGETLNINYIKLAKFTGELYSKINKYFNNYFFTQANLYVLKNSDSVKDIKKNVLGSYMGYNNNIYIYS